MSAASNTSRTKTLLFSLDS